MLILSRKKGESIVIGGNARVTVVDIRGPQIRLGIEAPDNVLIHREEIYEKIQREKAGVTRPQE